MPRGVPKAGYRMTKKRRAAKNIAATDLSAPVEKVSKETDAQIDAKLRERFEVLEIITQAAIDGDVRATIVSGPPGLGKSWTIEQAMENWDPSGEKYSIISGTAKPTGLYRLLWQHKDPGQVIIFDDCDSVFQDDISLGFLKKVCDTLETRRVSYLADYEVIDDKSGEAIPRTFEFNGTIIFITNIDFDAAIERGTRIAADLQAMVSRSMYIDLGMKTKRDYIIRIRQVVKAGMLRANGLTPAMEKEVVSYFEKHHETLRELSLRMVLKLGKLRKTQPKRWQAMARVTCHRPS